MKLIESILCICNLFEHVIKSTDWYTVSPLLPLFKMDIGTPALAVRGESAWRGWGTKLASPLQQRSKKVVRASA